ncbi:hypothetical protein TCAL_03210 [Tigriopus californicus]|uniref:Platelet-derived growth factor (PDGF) family profile domain-containing protein n=1 Tax=Tigriopus californicus TaxID=6832 RepID=A0A553NTT9_TIGCA|nr:vascular endothelial growth factor A-A-like [Tigriopus californicus]TRY68855.1 hypothetical protein TCAL_03210 [Tigriopus californicus]|eukprot:TCALIF_03210-PA protein Name:"Protein of unknown function" AED:0.13 eAED:0.13 QI:0/-1/0/1/-1/1/1/0/299
MRCFKKSGSISSLNMNLGLLLLNLSYLKQGVSNIEAVEYVSQGSCTQNQQRNILSNVPICQTREVLVDLRQHMSNASNIIQVIPDFAPVQRCGGSCQLYSHRCIPTSTRKKRLEVMTVLSQFPQPETQIQCGYVEIEEHVGCACGCPVQASDCRSDQYYSSTGCQCICKDQEERNRCILRGMRWDIMNCMCICPISSWKVCSTGYIFDFSRTCQCVTISTTASTGLLTAIIVLVTCMVVSVIGGYVMYKNQIGLFRSRSRRNISNHSLDEEEDKHLSREPIWDKLTHEQIVCRTMSEVD